MPKCRNAESTGWKSKDPDLENPATENVDVAALNKLEEEHWAQVDEFDLEGMVKAAIDKPGN
ncbi:hypothetical protein SERLADRAFT_438308 [Serpula lacrymans var. lacrymans S7.9]|uniref:Uncharacterized protein n=1 Tax=Serpula lacrymans var. lacrymans (strain S7.9) TaxID=578457 RepID=F8NXL8_SERL9|nr:uncharacterized protein SERLADRAFT_438308 [Serpula lacrymans var. lacrymans S7.9]EGO24690.1 hypothetical protein SERLADRAFT_438308 [Serpula lacrymans var. lacrymans S7.9]